MAASVVNCDAPACRETFLCNLAIKKMLVTSFDLPECFEAVEYVRMSRMWRLINTDGVDTSDLIKVLDAMRPTADPDVYAIYHEWRRSSKTPKHGRYYSNTSLIRMKRLYRNYVVDGTYTELDLRASNPTILVNVMRDQGKNVPVLSAYVANRDSFHEMLKSEVNPAFWNQTTPDGDKFSPKLFVNSTLNGSRVIWDKLKFLIPQDSLARKLKLELDYCLDYVFTKFADIPYNPESYNVKGSRMTNMLLSIETGIVYSVIQELTNQGILQTIDGNFNCGYAYDGILIPSSVDLNQAKAVADRVILESGYEDLVMVGKSLVNRDFTPISFVNDRVRVPQLQDFEQSKILIRYPTGQGKTFQAINYALASFQKVLIIVHRQALAHDIAKNYPLFENYLNGPENTGTFKADKQIICLNSLDKLEHPEQYQCVIVDEISSILRQVVEMKMSSFVLEMFRVFLTSPRTKLLACDALLCDQDILFLRDAMPNPGMCKVLTPVATNPPTKTCTIYEDEDFFKTEVANALAQDKKVCIAYSVGIARMNGFCESLGPRFINVNRYTKHNITLNDWLDYKLVCFSPTMDAGVDASFFENDGSRMAHFDVVFGYFNADNTTPKQAVQMLGRVRDCEDFGVYISSHYKGEVFDDSQSFENFVLARKDLIEHFDLTVYLTDEFVPSIRQDFRYLVARNSVMHRRESQKSAYSMFLKHFLIMNRWKLRINCETEADEEVISNIKRFQQAEKRNETEAIARARIMTMDEFESCRSGDVDLQTHREMLAFQVMNAFGLDVNRPPFPQGDGLADPRVQEEIAAYKAEIQAQQFNALYCYDGEERVSFDYLSEWAQSKTIYYRIRQLINLETGERTNFPFLYHKRSFNETVHTVRMMLRTLGFETLGATSDTLNFQLVETNPHFAKLLKGKKCANYLRREFGLDFNKENGRYKIVSHNVSSNAEDDGIYYIHNCPIGYRDSCPDGFVRHGSMFKCSSCFKVFNRRYATRHSCRPLPEGFVYREINGEVYKHCQRCGQSFRRNLARHAERCE